MFAPSRSRSRSRAAVALLLTGGLVLAACGGTETPDVAGLPVADDAATEVLDEAQPHDDASDDAAATDEEPAPDETSEPDQAAGPEEPAGSDDAAGSDEASAPAPEAPAAAKDCSAQGAEIVPKPADGLPPAVVAARDLLLDAALRCDEQLLRTAIDESEMFTFTFGAAPDAIGYWWDLEQAGEDPFLRLAQVLGTTPALSAGGDVYVWPRVTTGRPEDTTDAAWAELTWLEDPAAARATGDGYLDWRAGITPDGQWRFFVAGD